MSVTRSRVRCDNCGRRGRGNARPCPCGGHLRTLAIRRGQEARDAYFLVHVNHDGPVHPRLGTTCWDWTGGRTPAGYGRSNLGGGPKVYAHRYAWERTNGPVPDGMDVLHHCDRPCCVNPGHLWLGTASDNGRDMVSKGRDKVRVKPESVARGEQHGNAKLNADRVREIRRRMALGESSTDVGRDLAVAPSTVRRVYNRKSWRHLE